MKKIYLSLLVFGICASLSAQVTIASSIVPKYIQGKDGTNNNRMPFAFYAQFSGMLPNAWYRYFTALDTFGSINTGGGNTWLLNKLNQTVRRSTNSTLNNTCCHDSIFTDASGNYEGWFMVESTGNIRFKPGNKVYPFVLMNDGAGGIASVNRMRFTNDTMTVLNFGTVSGDTLQCSAIWDSTTAVPKSFVLLYDDTSGTGRPLACTIVEDDGLQLSAITSFSSTYKSVADSLNQYWCTYIPNANSKGVKRIEYRDWNNAALISYLKDDDGIWCSGVNTVNPQMGEPGAFLNSLIVLEGQIAGPDSAGFLPVNFSVTNTNALNFQWDFGDGSPLVNGQNVSHSYSANGWYYITCVISGVDCALTLTDSIFIDVTLSNAFENNIEKFKVYPTILTDYFVIEGNSGLKNYNCVLRDVVGRELKRFIHSGKQTIVYSTDFIPGIYFLEIKDSERETVQFFRLIKE